MLCLVFELTLNFIDILHYLWAVIFKLFLQYIGPEDTIIFLLVLLFFLLVDFELVSSYTIVEF